MQKNAPALMLISLLLCLLAAQIILRLNKQGLWGDEGWSVMFTDGDSILSVADELSLDRHPPLYFVLLHTWRGLAGDSLLSLRYLALLAALLSGAALFRLGRALFDTEAALMGLFFLALQDQFTLLGGEARHYTLLFFWGLASSAILALWIKRPQAPAGLDWLPVGYTLCLIMGLYTHLFSLWFMLIQGAYVLYHWRLSGATARFFSLWGLAGLAFLPWAPVFYYQYQQHGGLQHALPLTWATAETLAPVFLGLPAAFFGGLALIGLLSPGLRGRYTRPILWGEVLFLWLSLALPLGLILGLPQVNPDLRFLTDRNLSIILPALALSMGLGLLAFRGLGRALLLMFILGQSLSTDAIQAQNPPWPEVAVWLAAHQQGEVPILLDVGGDAYAVSYHLRQAKLNPARISSVWDISRRIEGDTFTHLRFVVLGDSPPVFWLIHWTPNENIPQALESWGYQRELWHEEDHRGGSIKIYRYQQIPP